MKKRQTVALAAALVALSTAGAWAQTSGSVTLTAAPAVGAPFYRVYGETYMVGVNGPGSDTYMDVEGAGNGKYATFGVIDFTNTIPAFLGKTITSVAPTIQFRFGDAPFGPTSPGSLNFYLTTNNSDPSTLAYNPSAASTGGVGTQLGDLILLGSGQYVSTSKGGPGFYTYDLTLPTVAQNYLVHQFNNSDDRNGNGAGGSDPGTSTIRFVVADVNNDKEVASFTGAGNVGLEPTLTVTVSPAPTPEPSQAAVLALGMASLAGLAIARRRKSA